MLAACWTQLRPFRALRRARKRRLRSPAGLQMRGRVLLRTKMRSFFRRTQQRQQQRLLNECGVD